MAPCGPGAANERKEDESASRLLALPMRPRLRDPRRFASGLLFMAIGAFGMIRSEGYRMGTATHMGPGYFPFVVSAFIASLGFISAVTSVGRVVQPAGQDRPVQWHIVPLVCILAGVVAFGLLVEPAGLVVAIVAVVIPGCYQRLLSRPLEVAVIGVILVAISVGLFIHGLGMPWHALPS